MRRLPVVSGQPGSQPSATGADGEAPLVPRRGLAVVVIEHAEALREVAEVFAGTLVKSLGPAVELRRGIEGRDQARRALQGVADDARIAVLVGCRLPAVRPRALAVRVDDTPAWAGPASDGRWDLVARAATPSLGEALAEELAARLGASGPADGAP